MFFGKLNARETSKSASGAARCGKNDMLCEYSFGNLNLTPAKF